MDAVLPTPCLGETDGAEEARINVGGFMNPAVVGTG